MFTHIPECRAILPAKLNPVLLKHADGLNNNYDLCIDKGVKIPLDSILEYMECYPAKSLENEMKTKYLKVDSIPSAGILYGKTGGLINSYANYNSFWSFKLRLISIILILGK